MRRLALDERCRHEVFHFPIKNPSKIAAPFDWRITGKTASAYQVPVAIFYPFSRLCEIGIPLTSL